MPVDIRKQLKKLLPYLLQAQADKLNEADTVQRLIKFFEDVLGYDGMTDISREDRRHHNQLRLAGFWPPAMIYCLTIEYRILSTNAFQLKQPAT